MSKKFIGGSSVQGVPDLGEVERLLALRGITGISPEAVVKRVVRYRASDNRVDSHGDVILADAWDLEEWLQNPQFLLNHDSHSAENIIGRGLDARSTPNGLFCDVFFFPPELATSAQTEAIFKLVKAGAFPDCSVGFRPKKNGYHWPNPDEEKTYEGVSGVIFTHVTLKELSAVTIGANVGAKVTATAKMLKTLNDDEIRSLRANDSTAFLIDAATFREKGATVQAPGVEILAGTIADLTKTVGDLTKSNDELRKELAKKNQNVLTDDEIADAVIKMGEVVDILSKNLPTGGTPAPEKPKVDDTVRNLSASVESLEKVLTTNNAK